MYKGDEKWVTDKITSLASYDMRKQAYDGYMAVYDKVFDAEPIEHKKVGQARKAANTALRKFIIKCNNWSEQ